MDGSAPRQSDAPRRYEEKIKSILQSLNDINSENSETFNQSQKKLEEDMIEIEKIIDEECMNRILGTHKINMALIGKLRDSRYDFNQDRSHLNYDNIIDNAINALKRINSQNY